ncbi:MAG: NAD-glutamate dehydrogenase [Alteromonadaceae bacterium]|nr:NAD-glutamate dehydrogenase [Alteromonadaceae bacterium]
MNALTVGSKNELLEKIDETLKNKLDKKAAGDVASFARQYFSHLPLEEITSRRLSDTYGALLTAWQFLQRRKSDEAKINVFNPDLEQDGWQSTHTVIHILHPNMPFLIDSLRIELNQREIGVYTIHYAVPRVERDGSGNLQSFTEGAHPLPPDSPEIDEALIVLEVDRHSAGAEMDALRDDLHAVLREVRVAVADFPQMREKARDVIEELDHAPHHFPPEMVEETRAYIRWLIDDHFTFLGFDEYDFTYHEDEIEVNQVGGSELGILRNSNERPQRVRLSDLPKKTRAAMVGNEDLLIFAKSAQRSRVHRPAYPDYIAIKKVDAEGRVIGERRFLGLYTSRVYNERPGEIPIIRRKVNRVFERSGFPRDDYAGKELDQILTVYPRDELFQMSTDELLNAARDILYIQERRQIRLFMREEIYGQFVTCLVFVPRDVYSTELRVGMQNEIMRALDGQDIEFTTYFSESVLARTQFTVRVPQSDNRVLPTQELEDKIVALAQSWTDGLFEALVEAHGEEEGIRLAQRYQNAFPGSYRDIFSPRRAAIDIDHMCRSEATGRLEMSFYRAVEQGEDSVNFKLFHPATQLPLSDVLPIFENLGFRVIGEHPFETVNRNGQSLYIHDFSLFSHGGLAIDIPKVRPILEELFERVWYGEAENDIFNRLALAAYFDWRQIAMFRSFARYMQQIRISNSQQFIASTLVSHTELAEKLMEFFHCRFNPERFQSGNQCEAAQQKLELEFNEGLDQVANLSEDRVLRLFLSLMKATLRTNYYQPDEQGQPKTYISFKIKPGDVPDMPLPVLMYEIFVYSPRVEGVHMRGGKVARGGLRWSDRYEDYRTEILGLVKAQQVKNAVIVPVGAKGGFVAKQLPETGGREAFQNEGIEAYKMFIRGLLDITDNFLDNQVVPPRDVLRHDDDDYYLVVAADKGTATFSDTANALSAEYGFWLGDAFASGGSNGYDHKKMGITARGAWVSVERHFREFGINTRTTPFTVVGVGDMAGDVFGNGMLLSPHIELVAAFNHMHIFVDPNPDAAATFAERERMFALARSSWEDFNSELISAGGGVFSRADKSIPISAEMKKRFDIKSDTLPPNMLISHILRAQVDLLWLGGIGTYVKGSSETHSDVGDKANDALRVNGQDLRCKVIGEGANLGVTQLGRIEFNLNGGRSNTDFIDNSGGVDCSDHEVNMKILFNRLVDNGDLTEKQRNKMLVDMTEDVASLVLKNNYRQTQAISIASASVVARLEEYRRLIGSLESRDKLNRELEFLPSDEVIAERQQYGQGLTRPELSVLISYVKADLKSVLDESELPDNPVLLGELASAFPEPLVKRFPKALGNHQLRRQIVATQVANDMVNHMGINFVDRLQQSTGASQAAIATAYIIAREIYRMSYWWEQIEALDYEVPATLQVSMMGDLMRLIRRSTRWLLRNRRNELTIREQIERFSGSLGEFVEKLPEFVGESASVRLDERARELVEQGVPETLARTVAGSNHLYVALGIIEAQENAGVEMAQVANLYFAVGERLHLDWFGQAITALTPTSHWQALARESFREDLDWQQRALTVGVLAFAKSANIDTSGGLEKCMKEWARQHRSLIDRWKSMLTELRAHPDPEFSMFSVALRELLDLAQSTAHSPQLAS